MLDDGKREGKKGVGNKVNKMKEVFGNRTAIRYKWMNLFDLLKIIRNEKAHCSHFHNKIRCVPCNSTTNLGVGVLFDGIFTILLLPPFV